MKKLLLALLFGFSLPVLAIDCPADKPMEKNDECYPCTESENLFSKEECDKCPEFRKFENGFCIFTKSPYPDRLLFRSFVAEELYYAGGGGKVLSQKTDFVSCDYPEIFKTTPENCSQCSNRFFATYTGCVLCSEKNAYKTNKEECIRCPNREMGNRYKPEYGNYCALKQCPEGFFSDIDGNCKECSFLYTVESKEENCNSCANREWDYRNRSCILKECPEEYFRTKRGSCEQCSIKDGIETEEENCTQCPNRKYKDGICILKECPISEPVRNEEGTCRSCDSLLEYDDVNKKECIKCPNREFIGGKCFKKCGENEFRRYDQKGSPEGYCAFCNSIPVYGIYTTEQECNRCSDSEYIDGRCYKKCNEGTFRNNDKKCVSCDVNGGWIEEYYYEFGPTWIISGKPTDFRFSLKRQNLEASLQECNKCSNREYLNGFCVKKCTEDEFRDNEGYCIKCESVYVEQPESTPKEEELGFVGKIHSGEKVRIVKGTSGGSPIRSPLGIIPGSSLEECNKCSNRKYEDGKCPLKNAIK